jgi:hypothetical protein
MATDVNVGGARATEAIARIVTNLDDQVRIYEHLLGLAQRQFEALNRQDVRVVHAVLQDIELAMLERGKVEVRRAEALEAIAGELGIPMQEVTASLLQQVSDAPIAEAIAAASAHLRRLIGDLDAVVGKNRVLLEHELGVIDHLVKGMTTNRVSPPTYGQTGVQADAPRLKILDAQV